MGRPDLTEVRTAEILDAFEACVARYGLEGSSLELVAEEAGMKRSILRHYVGNRDELILALAKRVVAKYRDHLQVLAKTASEDRRLDDLLSFFFPDMPVETASSLLVMESLIAAAPEYPEIRHLMSEYIDELVTLTGKQLRTVYPRATRQQCWSVAYGIVCICFNHESLVPLNLDPKYLKAARDTARRLAESLNV